MKITCQQFGARLGGGGFITRVHRPFAGKERNPKSTLQSIYTLLTKGGELWENDITKVGVGVELLGVVNLGWVYVWQKLMIDKGYFSEVYLCRPTLVMSFFGNTGCFPSPG